MNKVYREYVVTALNVTCNKVFCDVFTAHSEADARHSFRECYRHDTYKILSTAPTGRD